MLSEPAEHDGILGEALVEVNEPVATGAAEAMIFRHYGLRCRAKGLSGEKDSNFHVADETGRQFLFKVVHGSEDRLITNLQTQALLHVAQRDPDVPIQRVIPALSGEAEVEGDGSRMIRLVTFMPGVLQRHATPSRAQRENVGAALARLQVALADFRHPAEDHRLAWDLKHVSDLRPLAASIPRADDRAILETILDRFDAEVAPRLTEARSQAVHNDLNGDNVVVDASDVETVTGILDFGDLVRTPLVIDVAVAAAYQLSTDGDPLEGALDLIRGFTAIRPLESGELDVLFDLILARMVLRISITEWRAARFPENSAYILRNTPLAWAQLKHLVSLPRRGAIEAIVNASNLRSR
ncbi:phosphotransferase [Lichenihabitans sp. Uapishka_5]|uniref:phosphotransferase n=1 Tax=Lichenihabitans sp. Uapishka_5 TaxID=3037302 RepID=UPI0029E7D1B4|nr:phosphotransferase [Lichenihabitans sp. Uapishka_5]MDX7952560.1 phosphotransferase [Lichenihabitans sp. Uapishka_5]